MCGVLECLQIKCIIIIIIIIINSKLNFWCHFELRETLIQIFYNCDILHTKSTYQLIETRINRFSMKIIINSYNQTNDDHLLSMIDLDSQWSKYQYVIF